MRVCTGGKERRVGVDRERGGDDWEQVRHLRVIGFAGGREDRDRGHMQIRQIAVVVKVKYTHLCTFPRLRIGIKMKVNKGSGGET